jgi:hypothetical protein
MAVKNPTAIFILAIIFLLSLCNASENSVTLQRINLNNN